MNVIGGGLVRVPVLAIACGSGGGGGGGTDESGTIRARVGTGTIHHDSRFHA